MKKMFFPFVLLIFHVASVNVSYAQSAYTKGENYVGGIVKTGIASSNRVLTRWDDLYIIGAKDQDVYVDIVFEDANSGEEYDMPKEKKLRPPYESTHWESIHINCEDYEWYVDIPYGYSNWYVFARFRLNERVIGESDKMFYRVFRNNQDQILPKTDDQVRVPSKFSNSEGNYSSAPGVVIVPGVTNNNSSSGSGSTRRTCPFCHGSGKGVEQIIYGIDYPGYSYYCSQCNRTTSHQHHTPSCGVCFGKGYVE